MPRFHFAKKSAGFSLLEMVVVLVIVGLTVGLVMQTQQSMSPTTCADQTRIQLASIQRAIKDFTDKNARFPIPSARNAGVDDVRFGQEADDSREQEDDDAIDYGPPGTRTLMFGALPFQALGLPSSFAADCWGNKFSYVVTTAATHDSSAEGEITLFSGTLKNPVQQAEKLTYVVISHGENGSDYGGVARNYTGRSHNWCNVKGNTDQENCDLTNANFFDAEFNVNKEGYDYFDDLLVYSGKRLKLSNEQDVGGGQVFAMGTNKHGQLGDKTNDNATQLVAVALPTNETYAAVTAGMEFACALAESGHAYCWGQGGLGQLGDGVAKEGRETNEPVAVDSPVTLKQIAAGHAHVCALGTDDQVYCWGNNASGQLGNGTQDKHYSAELIDTSKLGGKGASFKYVAAGGDSSCAIATDGITFCWGNGYDYQLGNSVAGLALVPESIDASGLDSKLVTVAMGAGHTCGVSETGKLYCWGSNKNNVIGSNWGSGIANPTWIVRQDSASITYQSGGENTNCTIASGSIECNGIIANYDLSEKGSRQYKKFVAYDKLGCGIGSDNLVYCVGENDNTLGDENGTSVSGTPLPLSAESLSKFEITQFSDLAVGSGFAVFLSGEASSGGVKNGNCHTCEEKYGARSDECTKLYSVCGNRQVACTKKEGCTDTATNPEQCKSLLTEMGVSLTCDSESTCQTCADKYGSTSKECLKEASVCDPKSGDPAACTQLRTDLGVSESCSAQTCTTCADKFGSESEQCKQEYAYCTDPKTSNTEECAKLRQELGISESCRSTNKCPRSCESLYGARSAQCEKEAYYCTDTKTSNPKDCASIRAELGTESCIANTQTESCESACLNKGGAADDCSKVGVLCTSDLNGAECVKAKEYFGIQSCGTSSTPVQSCQDACLAKGHNSADCGKVGQICTADLNGKECTDAKNVLGIQGCGESSSGSTGTACEDQCATHYGAGSSQCDKLQEVCGNASGNYTKENCQDTIASLSKISSSCTYGAGGGGGSSSASNDIKTYASKAQMDKCKTDRAEKDCFYDYCEAVETDPKECDYQYCRYTGDSQKDCAPLRSTPAK